MAQECIRANKEELWDTTRMWRVPTSRARGCPTVRERLDAAVRIVTPLDEQRAREVARSLRKRNAAAVAVCFMHAFMNGANDRHMKAVLEEELPGLPVTTRSYGRTWVMAA